MNHQQQSWQRLAAAARAHRETRDESAPYGFGIRVAARAHAGDASNARSVMEKFAFRGLLAACTLGLAATAYGLADTPLDDTELAPGDIVSQILDQS